MVPKCLQSEADDNSSFSVFVFCKNDEQRNDNNNFFSKVRKQFEVRRLLAGSDALLYSQLHSQEETLQPNLSAGSFMLHGPRRIKAHHAILTSRSQLRVRRQLDFTVLVPYNTMAFTMIIADLTT
eukprot:scaffold1803_cov92-Amphora_coffeaeformis.AAC.59